MSGFSKTFAILAFIVSTVAGASHAQTLGNTEIFFTSATRQPAVSLGLLSAPPERTPSFDYALFATELIAYLTKEVLPDSIDEFQNSPLGSRLSRSMPDHDSEFGAHCLTIVTRIGGSLPFSARRSSFLSEPSRLDYVLRAATAALALRQVWSAFENHVEGGRAGVSLNPKVSSRRLGVNLTLHW